jgi:hypothetical protein
VEQTDALCGQNTEVLHAKESVIYSNQWAFKGYEEDYFSNLQLDFVQKP